MARGPQPIGELLADLMARRGFARVQSARSLEAAWCEVAGELIGEYTRPAVVRRGKLEVIVANSTLVQELTYQKPALLRALADRLPEEKIKDLRFRVGPVEYGRSVSPIAGWRHRQIAGPRGHDKRGVAGSHG